MKMVFSNKILLGAVLAIVGIVGVLFAPKPINSISLLVMVAGIGLVAYTVISEKGLLRPSAGTAVAVPSA